MAQLTINQCQKCGKILAPGVTECGKCHTKHSIRPTVVDPLRFTAAEVADYRQQFQENAAACPKDPNAQFAMGLTYLGLKNYELADEYLAKAVKLTPADPDIYYYTALSLFHHRSVVNLSKKEMNRIEEWLNTAVQMQPKRKYLILQMILRQGMSNMGINVDTDKLAPAELLEQARVTTQEEDEMQEIEQHVLITDEQTRILLDKLQSGNDKEEGESPTIDEIMYRYSNFCDMPRGDDNEVNPDNIIRLQDEEERQQFFRSLWYPNKPYIEPKLSYIGPIWRSIWTVLVAFVVWFIVVIVIAACGWMDGYPIHIPTEKQRLEEITTKKMTKKQIAELREQCREAYEKDSARNAMQYVICYYYKDESSKLHFVKPSLTQEEMAALPQDTEFFGMQKSWKGWLAMFLFFLPWLWWSIAVIVRFILCARDRRGTQRENDNRKRTYEHLVQLHLSRPTVAEYKAFCCLFAGPNDTSIVEKGDFVQEALRQAHLSEKDVQNGNGKIFFACYLMDTDENGRDTHNPAITLRDVIVRVCIAMRDSIIYLHGVWDSTSDRFPIFDQERLLYSQIANFRNVASYSTLEVISHSNSEMAKIIYAYGDFPSLFQYQGLDAGDQLTYSTTRTSNFDEFYNSLVKMHTAYIKS
ncbi:MAG: hypothetical protein II928_00735 [Paludibacteraceae bacterium]|nr:hypothetical protein [Paludibacteraceae bacterium]